MTRNVTTPTQLSVFEIQCINPNFKRMLKHFSSYKLNILKEGMFSALLTIYWTQIKPHS